MSTGGPLERATLAAMRDAAAKFLVQFPQQPPGQQLSRDEPLSVQSGGATADTQQIEALPIEEGTDADGAAPASSPAPPAAAPAPPAPAPSLPSPPKAVG
jgi:hypothetical protein